MEIYNFQIYSEKHTGPNHWEQKVVMKNEQENNRAKALQLSSLHNHGPQVNKLSVNFPSESFEKTDQS